MSVSRIPFVVLGFSTTHAALEAESVLRAKGIEVVPVPTPRSMGHSCGIAMRVPPEQVRSALDALAEHGVESSGQTEIIDLVRG